MDEKGANAMLITTPENDIRKILFTSDQIAARVAELGAQLTQDYKGKKPVVVCILKGAVFFYVDLCRQLQCNIDMDFIDVSSYGESSHSTGVVRLIKDLENDITNRHVLLVEDVIDSGLTLRHLRQLLAARHPASIKTCCLLDKVAAHPADQGTEYRGFTIGNEFVVGYGLDYAEYYRNLPYIGVLDPKVYSE